MERNDYPKFQNFGQLLRELHNDKLQKEFLSKMRWGNTPKCIHCSQAEYVRIYSKPGFYECSSCKIQFSVLQGTIFERSPIPLDIWFWAIFEFCTGLTSSPVAASRHTLQQKTAWKVNMRIREALWEELNTKLTGTIYCDETELGPNPQMDLRVFHDKRIKEKLGLKPDHFMNVFGMLETGKTQKAKPTKQIESCQGGRLLLVAIDDKSHDTLQRQMITKTDAYNSKFITDGWKGYNDFNLWCDRHYILNKSTYGKYDYNKHVRKVNEYSLELATEAEIAAGKFMTLTNNPIENVWRHLSLAYKTYFGFSKEYAQLYFNEFMFRWNHEHLTNGERFELLLKRCLNTSLYDGKGKNRKKIALQNKFIRFPKTDGSGQFEWKTIT